MASIFQQNFSSTAMKLANAPGMVKPISSRLVQWFGYPLRHGMQRPHQIISSTVTMSPTASWVTSLPTSTTFPENSCPRMVGNLVSPGYRM